MLQEWMMANIHLPALGEALGTGIISTDTATEAMLLLAGGYATTVYEAIGLIGTVEELAGVLDALPLDKQINIKINVQADKLPDYYNRGGDDIFQPPPLPPPHEGPQMARGGSFTVPPGYPNDSFRMRVQSGERVSVTPSGGARSGGRQPVIVNQYFTIQGGGNPAFIAQQAAKAAKSEIGSLGNSMRG